MTNTDKILKAQALDIIFKRLGPSAGYWWTDYQLKDHKEVLTKFRRWAETIEDRHTKDAYMYWLDYYQEQLAKAPAKRVEAKRSEERYEREERERNESLYTANARQPISEPPKDF